MTDFQGNYYFYEAEGRIVEVPHGSFEEEIKKICRKITEERN